MKRKNNFSVIIFVVITILLIIMTVLLSKSNISNYIFLAVLASFVVWISGTFLKKANQIAADFQKATTALKNGVSWKEVQFSMPELQESYSIYCKELNRLQKETNLSILCNIEDYMSVSLVNQIVRKGICEAVPGFSTGIGILGTFLGLMLGLKNFNLGTDYETVQESIMVLINGIKTAFLTSIYGVIYSIVFSLIYRMNYHEACTALETFCEAFHIYAFPDAQNEINKAILQTQQKQTETIRKSIEEFMEYNSRTQKEQSELFCQNMQTLMNQTMQIQENQTQLLSNSIQTFNEQATETQQCQTKILTESIQNFRKNASEIFMEQTEIISKGIKDFTEKAIINQDKQLSLLVKSYLTTMNEEVLGGQLEELRSVLYEINTTALQYFNQVHEVVKQICDREDTFTENTSRIEQFSGTMQKYMDILYQYQEQIADSHQKVVSQSNILIQRAEKSIEINQESLLTADKLEKTMQTFTTDMNSYLNECKQKIFEIEETGQKQTSNMQDTCRKAIDTVNHVSQETSEMILEMKEIQQNTYQQFTNLSENQNAYLEQLRNDTDNTRNVISQVSDTIKKATEQIQQTEIFSGVLQKYMNQIYQYQNEITLSHEKITEQCFALMERADKSTAINQESLSVSTNLQKSLNDFTIHMKTQLDALQKQNDTHAKQYATVYDKTLGMIQSESNNAIAVVEEMKQLQDTQTAYLKNLYNDNSHITESLESVSESIKNSSEEMYLNYTKLSSTLENSFINTFKEFDTITSAVANNFLNLLKQVQEENDRMPAVQNEIYQEQTRLLKEWQKLLAEMNRVSTQLKEMQTQQEEAKTDEE